MEIADTKILILGGWGLVGSAIARALLAERPAEIVVHSLREAEAEAGAAELRSEYPDAPTRFTPVWGNLFVRESLKDVAPRDLLARSETRRDLIDDAMAELSPEILEGASLYRLLADRRPDVVVDCINTATAFAYQDVFYNVRRVQEAMGWFDAGDADASSVPEAVERLLSTLALPQLIRHVQILREGLSAASTRAYMKIGTTGTGGMGLNIPYTHSEERPSRVLLSKSSVAGAHSMLLYLLARTPGGPIVKEIKPSAAIAWKRIGTGPVLKGGQPIRLYDCPPDEAVPVETALSGAVRGWSPLAGPDSEPRVLESVWVDTGENGMFAAEEFETVTALGQMEFVTPEEIARNVVLEIRGGTTGREVVAALDSATMGPTYRAGVMRHRALERMRRLEREHGLDSVAFEMLGPPHLSKLLYEAHLLRRVAGSLRGVAEADPAETAAACERLIVEDQGLRARILSIGLGIRLSDGRILRGPDLKVPPYKEEAVRDMDAAAVERWADAGWVDLAPANFVRWRDRARRILAELDAAPADDTSSALYEDREYWLPEGELPPGRVAAWVLGVEERGAREKAQ